LTSIRKLPPGVRTSSSTNAYTDWPAVRDRQATSSDASPVSWFRFEAAMQLATAIGGGPVGQLDATYRTGLPPVYPETLNEYRPAPGARKV
jgi:hypothetical protein